MKNKSIFNAGSALILLSLSATAGTVPFDINTYSFQLQGGGGGVSATLNGVSVEAFCDDFDNNISPWKDYTADITTLGTSADLSDTRFGSVSSNAWTTISLTTGNWILDYQNDLFFNSGSGSSALARYEMAAYLVSLYNPSLGNNTSNNQIQEAIWMDLDPKSEGAAIDPSHSNASSDLEQAANWYSSMNTSANLGSLNSFLAQFEIVSPSDMNFTNGLGNGGFQEQIVMTPEPRGGMWLLLGLLGAGLLASRRRVSGVKFQNV